VNAPPDGGHVEVLDVIDGNTVVAGTSTSHVKVRVIGIDTPETVHPDKAVEPFGPEATARARELLLGRTVCIQYDPDPAHDRWDKYGRLLAYVQLPDGRDFGQVIVEEGLGRAYTKFPFSRQVQYVQVEATARENAIGLWAAGAATIPPSN
jgi:micrococcal nuclease